MAIRVIRALARPFVLARSMLQVVRGWFVIAWTWFVLTWRKVDDTMPQISPVPKRFGDLQFKAGLAALNGQYAQIASIDSKIAVGGGISLAVIALIPSGLAAFDMDLSEPNTEHWFILAGAIILLFAFVNSVRGLWPRSHRELPDLSKIRQRLAEVKTDDRAFWDIAIPIEQAVIMNERVVEARLAAVKIAYSSLLLGFALILAGFGLPLICS